jgi:hypothetical protein
MIGDVIMLNMSFHVTTWNDVKEKKTRFILGFLWNSYHSYTYWSLKLDIIYTILFVGPMHMLKTKKIKRFLWGVENGVCGSNFCQIFNISALVLISAHVL